MRIQEFMILMTNVNERHGQCYPLPFIPSTYPCTILSFAFLIKIILVIGGIEINPGPNNRLFYKHINIVHNNVCSLLPKVDIVLTSYPTMILSGSLRVILIAKLLTNKLSLTVSKCL